MNKSKIEWTDFTWNPVTGCWGPGGTREELKRCWYCYAIRLAKRFGEKRESMIDVHGLAHQCGDERDWKTPLILDDRDAEDSFAPTHYPGRHYGPRVHKKPARIFVGSMCDLLGDWVPAEWIKKVLDTVRKCPQHTFQFLTKNPKRYLEFDWPSNCWLGATATDQESLYSIEESMLAMGTCNTVFVSLEPLLGEIRHLFCLKHFSWIIVGAMTGAGLKDHQPYNSWVDQILGAARLYRTPIFLKRNLNWPEKIQEFPNEMPM